MKSKFNLVLIFAIAAFVCLTGWRSSAQTSNKVTWEYKIYTVHGTLPLSPSPNMNEFNKMGAEGWEFVESRSEDTANGSITQRKVEYYFKRMK
jgi:hypothetical protein